MSKNSIVKRYYYWFQLELLSPMAISNGDSINTDKDVSVDGEGIPFVAATSVAGAFREYATKKCGKSNTDLLFGYLENDGKMSAISFSDIRFTDDSKIVIRDRVALKDDDQVNNKMDIEVIETGISGNLFFNMVIREMGITEELVNQIVKEIYQGINLGHIRFGGIKSRGYGRMKIVNSGCCSFGPDKLNEYLTFKKNIFNLEQYQPISIEENKTSSSYKKIKVDLDLDGSLMIRVNGFEKGEPDQIHMKANGVPVIPGTSWNGPIRKNAKKILKELEFEENRIEQLINKWFGSTEHKSLITIDESIITDGIYVPVQRTAISRFEGATKTGALLSEVPVFNGKTQLCISIETKPDYQAILGLLYLVINDIGSGYITIGGEANIGRGIFRFANGTNNYLIDKKEEIRALKYLARKVTE